MATQAVKEAAQKFGKDLAIAMRIKGYNQTSLAKKMGVFPGKICEYVNGKRFPKPERMQELCKILDITYDPIINLNKLNVALIKDNFIEPDDSKFSERLRYLISINGISMSSLAKYIKVSRQSVKNYVDGYNLPSYDKLPKIAEFFNKPLDYFFTKEIKEKYNLSGPESIVILRAHRDRKTIKSCTLNDIKNIIDKCFTEKDSSKIFYALMALKSNEPQRDKIINVISK